MINFYSIKQKIQLLALAIPVFADDSTLNFSTTSDFEKVTTVTPDSFLTGAISISLIAAVAVFLFILITGGIKWITSNGDEKKLATARSQITNALVGLFLILSSYAILNLIELLFGIKILDGLHIPSLIPSSSPPGIQYGDPSSRWING